MSAFDQGRYQVRLDWGVEGVERLAPADVYVVVDALGTLNGAFGAAGEESPGALAVAGDDGATVLAAAAAVQPAPLVLFAGLRNAAATARAAYEEQNRRSARTSIALVPAGHGGRVTVEDQLAAGAVADALSALGIDHSAPDVAVAAESFRALRRAVKHLLTASGTGLALEAAGARDVVLAAARVDDVGAALRYVDGELRSL
ncbi:2-phosphosulfolactate phosphatase [Microbacterium sp. Marseille-Q6965]|uniref:2-phosphosulfolactate phosphatase n=1 Tax=Microbacterium sp. Marseille-Q6965 TaxID=2965072 RepID=UPI0021B6FEF2|nr:2-phosphosulfolactate phosphatase [Microbacterium sp. Marseille-Q6965]